MLCTVGLFAQSDAYAKARAAATAANPSQRIAAFDSLLATGKSSPELYLALGNAHVEAGALGSAILAYERGLRLNPGNEVIKNNLAFTRQQAGIERLALPDFFLARWWRGLGAALGAGTLFWLAMLFWWLAVAGAIAWYLRRDRMNEKQRFALLPGAGICLLLAVVCYAAGDSRNAFLNNDTEVVLTQNQADLRVAPGPQATLEKTLSQGLKMRVIDENQGYLKVVLDDGAQGWLPEDMVERI